ncbi:UDP-N-acetylmuramoyl-L-alanyl-D-glutamate--2,6-diaminopimelate ligase [Mesonia hippocampi]|uniref:UDP-N-acetylmuramoyl-L-alanyl-D-glutamate--2,6-diaminopimelate ligase n=1 Tax=Mesonia hippocampi TaxID=1628250 RepID=A0A840EKH2_9FLAO|nr:UDP-N-acetylmuramoyl-L-alanyl-D-glutamate--2,6-diaminopimelate ligase [Mesonia hippocampi]MBB4118648.1 UDP-N-acetylmuramoyl-L-alanyl-D-glutamate--2,6-diaminopimelate ligase [Mesonia hippocampi]
MQLKELLYKVEIETVVGDTSVAINKLTFDSRTIETEDVFIAIVGDKIDGHKFIEAAINKGAIAIVCQELPTIQVEGITYILVKDTAKELAILAANYYKNPSEELKLVGITGTNGKTTISSLLYQLFTKLGYKVGLISTVNIKVGDEIYATKLTTPDAITINKYLSKMLEAGVEFCFMEVSSHGIAQFRTNGLHFTGGVFTNLSHDHLDYHPTFSAYRDVKKSFFDQLPKTAFALTNIDDKNGSLMLQNTKAKTYTYALKNNANYKAKIIESSFGGTLLRIADQEVWVKLIGSFNAYNMLAIYAVAELLGVEKLENLKYISTLTPVDGRFEYFISSNKITAIVDYAHTPDALENVLNTINDIRTKNETLFTLVGCGGDRDTTKRPLMAKIAVENSTKVILTSDNPRTENPDKIIDDMLTGITPTEEQKTLCITNRKQAIKTAASMAKEGDIILIAGKGHETYQEINGERSYFNDMDYIKEFLELNQ